MMEAEQRSALLFMLEDLENSRRKVEQAHHEWMAALDVVNDPIFLHDKDFRILRCNKAYQQCAGIPFHEIIGKPYYEVFPKNHAPLPCCMRAMEKAEEEEEEEEEEEVAVGGAIYRSCAYSIKDEQGAYLYSVHTLEDITGSRHAEAALHESEEKFRKMSESAQDAIIMMADKRILFWNAAAERIFGYTAAEVIGQEVHALIVPSLAHARFTQASPHFQASGEGPIIGKVVELTALRKGGEEFPVELSVSATQFGGQWHAVGIVRDITQRKRAEEELLLRAQLLDNTADSIFVNDFDGHFVYLNEAAWKTRGYTRDEMMGMNLHVLDVPEYEKLIEARIRELMEKGRCIFESAHRCKDGSVMPIEVSARIIESGDRKLVLAAARDITERKLAEEQLKNSKERYRQIIQTSMDGFWITDTGGSILDVNDAYCQLTGYAREELLNMHIPDVEAKEAPEETAQHVQEIMAKGYSRFETRHRRKDGQLLDIEVSVVYRPDMQDGIFLIFLHDITERKQAEVMLSHSNRALATLSAVNRSLVKVTDEAELFQAICDAIVQQRGYRLAWVGYVLHDESKSIKVMARAGYDEGYLDNVRLTWAETERGSGLSGQAIRSGVTQVCQDMINDPNYQSWRDEASKRGYASDIVLPLIGENGSVFGILHVYSDEINTFITTEITLLKEMAGDLVFGLRSLHTRRERDLALAKNQEQLVQLRSNLEDTVRAIASIAEMRDPYTAGHQVKVADLAAAIAKQMALPEEQIHAIHLAGMVHDLGKIQVPAEILSKPGKITDLEFGLIKIHPQAGYDILKGIDFPWPIAQMVWQHHERLDGSGYPQGLKGDAILFEARILAVADVVEAMSSHRPYRPGLGIEAALAEITRQRGVHYDSRVVDACVAVFREQHYSFK